MLHHYFIFLSKCYIISIDPKFVITMRQTKVCDKKKTIDINKLNVKIT
jgi:hypothetical protein